MTTIKHTEIPFLTYQNGKQLKSDNTILFTRLGGSSRCTLLIGLLIGRKVMEHNLATSGKTTCAFIL